LGIISKPYPIDGTNIINAITIGNNIVQQKDISWSKRILGKEALIHMKIKIIMHDLKPKLIPYKNPSINGFEYNISLLTVYSK
jgi:hypothetical protein